MLDARKIEIWVQDHADTISELIPVKTCVAHENGMETCWGQDGHIWKDGHHQIMTICHPKAEEEFAWKKSE